jgi:hypothetical protein
MPFSSNSLRAAVIASVTEMLHRLQMVYGKQMMSQSKISEWHHCLKDSYESLEGNPQPAASNRDNVRQMHNVVCCNCHTVEMVVEEVKIVVGSSSIRICDAHANYMTTALSS